MKIFGNSFAAMEKRLDLSLRRHALLAGNIANHETPNYKAREYDFGGEIQKVMGESDQTLVKTSGKHMDLGSNGDAHVVNDNSMPVGADGNNVDLDIEMGKLAANSRDYQEALNLLGAQLKFIKAGISGRGVG